MAMSEAFTIDDADRLEHRVLRETFLYWQGLGVGTVPPYADINPVDMPKRILPHLVLADAEGDPPDFRFRLMGSAVDQGNGFSGTNMLLTEHHGGSSSPLLEEYRSVLKDAAPRYSTGMFVAGDQLFRKIERVIMPLRHSNDEPDAVFGAIVFHRSVDKRPMSRSDAR